MWLNVMTEHGVAVSHGMAFLLVSFWLGERVLFDLQALPSLWVSVRQVVGVGPGQAPDGLSFTALHPHFPINQIYYSTVHHIYKVKIMLKSSEQLWASSDCRLMNSANVFCSLSNPTIYTALIKSQSQTEHENLHSFWKILPSALSSILSLA